MSGRVGDYIQVRHRQCRCVGHDWHYHSRESFSRCIFETSGPLETINRLDLENTQLLNWEQKVQWISCILRCLVMYSRTSMKLLIFSYFPRCLHLSWCSRWALSLAAALNNRLFWLRSSQETLGLRQLHLGFAFCLSLEGKLFTKLILVKYHLFLATWGFPKTGLKGLGPFWRCLANRYLGYWLITLNGNWGTSDHFKHLIGVWGSSLEISATSKVGYFLLLHQF